MKGFKNILIGMLILVFAYACNEGIDPITHVDPGTDEAAPEVTVSYPTEGTQIRVTDAVTSINIAFEATDDIELGMISVKMDDVEIASFDDFKDYRRFVKEYLYEELTNGAHMLAITATDLEGKSTTASVNFEKVPPYQPMFDGEVFYMPFDGDFMELVTQTNAGKVGNPTFSTNAKSGSSYAGATDSYITFPIETLTEGSGFSAAMWYKLDATQTRAGIISISPAGEDRTKGIRFFREGSDTEQRFKLNVGTGDGEQWNDGGVIAAPTDQWVHLAFTVSETATVVYINGEVAMATENAGIDWTGTSSMTIGSGAPNFAYWDHKSDNSLYDEIRIFDKGLSQEEVQAVMAADGGSTGGGTSYTPVYDGETFYLPFDGDNQEMVSGNAATVVGTPGFTDDAAAGDNAYAGAADSYLTFPTTGITSSEFSASFWYKVDADPTRAGILTVSAEDTENANYPDVQNYRKSGFRLLREGDETSQIIKLDVGVGDDEKWFDGGETATVDATTGEWIHVAFSLSGTEGTLYINGESVASDTFAGIDWTGCDLLTIGSGAPRFNEWGHLSDLSYIDELRFFNKALSQEEVQTIIADNE